MKTRRTLKAAVKSNLVSRQELIERINHALHKKGLQLKRRGPWDPPDLDLGRFYVTDSDPDHDDEILEDHADIEQLAEELHVVEADEGIAPPEYVTFSRLIGRIQKKLEPLSLDLTRWGGSYRIRGSSMDVLKVLITPSFDFDDVNVEDLGIAIGALKESEVLMP